jgi:hypothetical protein
MPTDHPTEVPPTEDFGPGDYVLVAHPHFGSMWLSSPRMIDDHVVGEVEADRMFGHSIMETMNFPKSCIRKVERNRFRG